MNNNGIFDDRTVDEFISESNNSFRNFDHSDEQLNEALRGMEDRRSFFEQTDPFNPQRYISHSGFNFMKDLDEYIQELNDEIKSIRDYWRENGPRLEELNKKIEEKYANFRNGANRELDTEIDDLEEEYLGGLEKQEEDVAKLQELNERLTKLIEARKRWLSDIKERTAYTRKKKNELLEQLQNAKKELKDLEARQYAGNDSQFIKDRIEELKDIIENLEEQLKNFHKDLGFEIKEDKKEKVTVKFDLNGGTISGSPTLDDLIINKGEKISDHLVLNSPSLDEDHTFAGWTVDGEPFDIDTPIDKDVVVKATYKDKVFHKVTFRDSKGKEIDTIEVEDGKTLQPSEIPSVKNKVFKEFNGWETELVSDVVIDNSTLSTLPITDDMEFNASYKWSRDKIIGTAAALVATAGAVAIDVSRKAANPLAFPVATTSLATLNGILWKKFQIDKKKGKEPNEEAERVATGIKKPLVKLNNFRLRHLDGIKRYLGTSAVLSGAAAAGLTGFWIKDKLNAANLNNTPIANNTPVDVPQTPTISEPLPTEGNFQGIMEDQTIFKDLNGNMPNGRPAMQWFNHPLRYFRADGTEIFPMKDSLANGEIFKIVEVQPDGSEVVMGFQKAVENVASMIR